MRTTTLKNRPVEVTDYRHIKPSNDFDHHKELPPLTDEEEAEMDEEFFNNAVEEQNDCAERLRSEGLTVALGPIAWCCPVQEWVSRALGFKTGFAWDEVDETAVARRLTLTLELPGGDPDDFVHVTVETTIGKQLADWGTTYSETFDYQSLRVRSDGIFYRGSYDLAVAEMVGGLVMLRGDAPQEVAERVLAVMTSIDAGADDWPVPLYARLKPLNKCQACNRRLDDPVSRVLQIGPTCAKRLGLPHNQALADAVNRARESLS